MPDYRPALAEFRALPDNWNSYGGRPVTQAACDTLLRMAELLPAEHELKAVAIEPHPHGGVILSWKQCGIEAELEVGYTGEVACFLERGAEERTYHGEDGVPLFGRALRELITPWLLRCPRCSSR